jgi:hypothetical protein
MDFMLLIHEPRGQRADRGREAGEEAYATMLRFAADLQARGQLVAAESLVSDDRGTRVQVRDGRARTLDGPFTETKEMVGGYFRLTGISREQAMAIAAECPAAAWATVEVREMGPCFT